MTARWDDAHGIAASVREGRRRAVAVVDEALDMIARENGRYNAFTEIFTVQARAEAAKIDQAIAAGKSPGPLAGVPFAVKNLFDISGVTTLAGSKINRDHPPAAADAEVVHALRRAGAVLVGALNMDEYAFGFTTENAHYGVTRNPHDLARLAGGSSGGSATAVAAGFVPFTLGTDTGGSVRVPASLCGLFGLKPTFGNVSRAGTVLFAPSVDHVGPLARSVRDLALVYDLIQDAHAVTPHLGSGIGGLRIALAAGYFQEQAQPAALAAARIVAETLGTVGEVTVPHAAVGRAIGALVTSVEGAGVHLANLRKRPGDFDPLTRDRFIAGALLPGSAYARAQWARRAYRDAVKKLFQRIDILVTPTTPMAAPRIGEDAVTIEGTTYPMRAHLGRFTVPFSIIGLPVLAVPVRGPGLPRGVQLVAAPMKEAPLFRAAAFLERGGVVGFTPPD